jgi:hypothetical protein
MWRAWYSVSVGGRVVLEELLRLAVRQDAHADHLEGGRDAGLLVDAVLHCLGGDQLHGDEFVEHLILLVGGEVGRNRFSLQQVFQEGVIVGAGDGRAIDHGHGGRGGRVGGCGCGGRLLTFVAGRHQDAHGRDAGHHMPWRTKKMSHLNPLRT